MNRLARFLCCALVAFIGACARPAPTHDAAGSGVPRRAPTSGAAAPAGAVVAATSGDAVPASTAEIVEPQPRVGASPSNSTAHSAAAPSNASAGTFAATVEPACVGVGAPFVVRFASPPRASLALAIAFVDHEPHGLMGFADADEHGVYVWRLVVPADAPPGKAVVVAGARDPRDGSDVGTQVEFVVSEGACG